MSDELLFTLHPSTIHAQSLYDGHNEADYIHRPHMNEHKHDWLLRLLANCLVFLTKPCFQRMKICERILIQFFIARDTKSFFMHLCGSNFEFFKI